MRRGVAPTLLMMVCLPVAAACGRPMTNGFWFDHPELIELEALGRPADSSISSTIDCTPRPDSWAEVPATRQLPVDRGAMRIWWSPTADVGGERSGINLRLGERDLATWKEGTTLTEPSFLYSSGGFLEAGFYLALAEDIHPAKVDISCRSELPRWAALAAQLRAGERPVVEDWISLSRVGWDARPALPLPAASRLRLTVPGDNLRGASLAVACRNPSDATRIEIRNGDQHEPLNLSGDLSWLPVALESVGGSIEVAHHGNDEDDCLLADPMWTAPAPAAYPGILLVLVDGLRYDVATDPQVMPWLAARADSTVSFERTRVTAPWTRPSITSMLTGLAPRQHGLTTEARGRRLAAEIEMLPEVLRRHGYATASFSANPWLGPGLGLDRGFGRMMTFQVDAKDVLYEARLWIEAQRGPWFAVVFLMDTHYPFRHRPEFDRSSDNPAEPLDVGDSNVSSAHRRGGAPLPEASARKTRSLYLENAAYIDSVLNEFVRQVESLDSDAVVTITADHGEAFGEHRDFFHGWNLYEELVRVPLIIDAPSGHGNDDNASLRQLPATLLDIAGIEAEVNGPSLVSAGEKVIASFSSTRFRDISLDAVVYRRWKLITDPDGTGCQLYDLSADPAELNNLCDDRQEVKEALDDLLQAHRQATTFAPEAVDSSSEVDDVLRSLGYLDH